MNAAGNLRVAEFFLGANAGSFQPGHTICSPFSWTRMLNCRFFAVGIGNRGLQYTRGKYFKSFANSPQPFIV
jgi:hypothetical protein